MTAATRAKEIAVQPPSGWVPNRFGIDNPVDTPTLQPHAPVDGSRSPYQAARESVRSAARSNYFLGLFLLIPGLLLLGNILTLPVSLAGLGAMLLPFAVILVCGGLSWILLGIGIARRSRMVVLTCLILYFLPGLVSIAFGTQVAGTLGTHDSPASTHLDPSSLYLLIAISIFGFGGAFHVFGLLSAYRAIGVLRQRDVSVPASTDLFAQQ